MRRRSLFAVVAVSVVIATGCTTGTSDTSMAAVDRVLTENAQVSVDEKPVFVDVEGRLDSIFRSKGYVYGVDIVETASKGNADARYILAQMYAYGIAGARPDARRAYILYLGLADEGMAEAQAIAGHMLFYGLGTEADESEGVKLISKSVNQDCGLGYLFMGNFYAHNAPETEENRTSAKVCYAKAAALGIAEAEQLLEQMR